MTEKYVRKNGRLYWYVRRVPLYVQELDGREVVKISLKTDSESEAIIKAEKITRELNGIWDEAMAKEKPTSLKRYNRMVQLAKMHGFEYKPMDELLKSPTDEVIERVDMAKQSKKLIAKAALGVVPFGYPNLDECLEMYWKASRDEIKGKNDDEIRKWKNPRIKAIANFKACIGDKTINQITRKETMLFRSWWMDRIEGEELTPNSANKDFTHAKVVLCKVADTAYHDINLRPVFEALKIKGDGGKRASFDKDFITETLFNREKMKGLNDECFFFLHAMADTGARVKELVGLEPKDIILAGIPHIIIRKNDTRGLKNKTSERVIPLVGAALYAFNQLPEGFVHYRGGGDNL